MEGNENKNLFFSLQFLQKNIMIGNITILEKNSKQKLQYYVVKLYLQREASHWSPEDGSTLFYCPTVPRWHGATASIT